MAGATYPAPRVRSVEQALAGAGVVAVPAPRSRVWSFLIEAAVAVRTTVVSQVFAGPAMIHSVTYRWAGSGNNFGGLSLFASSDSSGAQESGSPTIIPSGDRIFARFNESGPTSVDNDEVPEHLIQVAPGVDASFPVVQPIRYFWPTPDQFYVKASVKGPNAGTFHVRGNVLVIQADSVETLLNFQ